MIKQFLWLLCKDNDAGNSLVRMVTEDKAVYFDKNSDPQVVVTPTLFSSTIVAAAPMDQVDAASVKQWIEAADNSSAQVQLVIPHNRKPTKAVQKYDPEVIDLTCGSVDSVEQVAALADVAISKKVAKKIVSAKDKASTVMFDALSVCSDGIITEQDVDSVFPFPEEKFFYISNAVFNGDEEWVEKLLENFDYYKTPWEAVSAFMIKQVMIAGMCNLVPKNKRKETAINLGISPQSVQFFLKNIPTWNEEQVAESIALAGSLDEMMKTGFSAPGTVTKTHIRAMVRV